MNISVHQDAERPVKVEVGNICEFNGKTFISLDLIEDNAYQKQTALFIFHDPAQLRQIGEAFLLAAENLQTKLTAEVVPPPSLGLVPKKEEEILF